MRDKKFILNRKFRHLLHILTIGLGFLLVLSLIFFTLFRVFERITYDSISDLNSEFAIQIDSLTESINSSIVNYGMQLFYSNSVKTLMGTDNFSNTNRVYMIRDLNTSLVSTDFAESIIIHNGYTNHVYSTDSSYSDQMLSDYRGESIKELLQNRTGGQRFKPIYCREDTPRDREYYTFMFYELYPDGTPKPSTLIITVKNGWYKKSLLASNPSSDLIVIGSDGSVLVAAGESLNEKYMEYYPLITEDKNSGYFINDYKKEICMFYDSATTGHTYMRISSLSKALPRLFYFKKIVVYFLVTISTVFGVALAVLLVFALIPMLKMRDAIDAIGKFQEGGAPANQTVSPLPLSKQLHAVVSSSERVNSERVLHDMLSYSPTRDSTADADHDPVLSGSSAAALSASLFPNAKGRFGLILFYAPHRKDIYEFARRTHPELIAAKTAYLYACAGVFESQEDYDAFVEDILTAFCHRCFVSSLFDDISFVAEHFRNLDELRKLKLTLPEDSHIIREEELYLRASNTIATKDFTDLIVKLKAGNLEAGRAKWREILSTILNYRYEDFQYILYRAEDTICNLLSESHFGLLNDSQKLLPQSLDQIGSLEEINTVFDRAMEAVCNHYSVKKAEKYSELADQIREMVQERYHDSSLNSQRIADMIHMNNAYLGRLFKSAYGRSINEYINTCRIEESMTLLRETDRSVEDIAQAVGFSNIKYFYVLFKKASGTTPAKYRVAK